ncbi:MAG: MBL fold metallo-hydrolase [Pseudomonadota bacterium]
MRKYFLILLLLFSACSPGIYEEDISLVDLEEKLYMHVFNVGQGSSTLFYQSNGASVLIDGGSYGQATSSIFAFIEERLANRVDYFLLTHFHEDHLGGLNALIAGQDLIVNTKDDVFPRGAFLIRELERNEGIEDYINYASDNFDFQEIYSGDIFTISDSLKMICYLSNGGFIGGGNIVIDNNDENSKSVAVLLTFAGSKILIAGDLTGGGESTIDMETALGNLVSEIDVLIVNHHGSNSSSNEKFLESTKPKIAIFSYGQENQYGHPSFDVIERFEKYNSDLYFTPNGDIDLVFSNHGVSIYQ